MRRRKPQSEQPLTQLSDEAAERLIYGIIRRAAQDYYNNCIVDHVAVRRTIRLCRRSGMTDQEIHQYLLVQDNNRRKARNDAANFMRSDWYKVLTKRPGVSPADMTKVMQELERKRRAGVCMFEED